MPRASAVTMVFPAATANAADPVFDPGTVTAAVEAALSALCGAPATLRLVRDAGELDGLAWWRRDDGLVCAAGGGARLAAALVGRDCGGAWDVEAIPAGSASIARRSVIVAETLRLAVASHWPGGGDWLPVAPLAVAGFAFAVAVDGISDRLVAAVVPPMRAATCESAASVAWRQRWRAGLDALRVPVRLVLHDGLMPVRAARALEVGDVLPIDTAYEVGLRIGSFALARGRIGGTDTGTAHVEIVARCGSAVRQPETHQ